MPADSLVVPLEGSSPHPVRGVRRATKRRGEKAGAASDSGLAKDEGREPRLEWIVTTGSGGQVSLEERIYLVRGRQVLLDADLAELYEVPVKQLNQQVRRNRERFPPDFLLELTWDEVDALRSQIVTLDESERGRGRHRKYPPFAFTEQGVAMLSSVLRSPRAVRVNIEIMRTFVRLRRLLAGNAELARKLSELEAKYDAQFRSVFDAIRALMAPSPRARRRIGFGE